MPLRLRRGTDAQRLGITPAEGELIYTTDTKGVYVGDGTTIGGVAITTLASGMVGNLAGNVNLNTFAIDGIGNIDIIGNISATGNGEFDGNLTVSGNIDGNHSGSFFADDSSTIIDGTSGTVVGNILNSISNIKITGGTNGQAVVTDGNGNLSFTTITGGGSGTINSGTANNLAYYASTGTAISGLSALTWDNGSSTLQVSGTVIGDFKGSVFGDDSGVIVDSVNSRVSPGSLILYSNKIDSLNREITMGSDENPFQNLILNCNVADPSPLQIRNIATSIGSLNVPRLWFETYGTNISRTTNTLLSAGQSIGGMAFRVVNPVSNGGAIVPAGGFDFIIDPTGSVTSSYATGKMVLATINGVDPNTDYSYLTFDRLGRLGVGKLTATEALDVNGNGKFTGFVQFGSLNSTQRTALTPVNGMVIYNSTSNRFQGYQNGAWINLDDGTAAP